MDSIKRLYGVYRGVVQDNSDPQTQRRLKVQVQTTGIEVTDWAWPMEPSSIHTEVPVVGQGVWITYVGGDPEYPVWACRCDQASSAVNGTKGAMSFR